MGFGALVLGALCFSVAPQRTLAKVNCSSSPDCAQLRREPCSVEGIVPNACGNCLLGTFGGLGPTNTVCMSSVSCAAILPGEDTCIYAAGSGQGTPFIIPFGRCVCDDGNGRYWPTSAGKCAQVAITLSTGAGLFEVQQCSTTTCEPASCQPLATWAPGRYPIVSKDNVSFNCKASGEDQIMLMDDCEPILSRQTLSALCGHAGFVATSGVFDALGNAPVDCVLASSCPASVLVNSRMQQSCCTGTMWSNTVLANGQVSDKQAPGFCPMVIGKANEAAAAAAAATRSPGNKSNVTTTAGPSPVPYECLVRTIAAGWTGCSCMDSAGFADVGLSCSVTCEPPLCPLPAGGIPPVPQIWKSSEISAQLFPGDGAVLAKATAALPLPAPLRSVALLLVAGLWASGASAAASHLP
eukprot:CAMPEP_0115048688 /NCGR_PEP_ID=MMETSP0227-20121206/733_1 /TAXON_ID=89957 /ORGANISM="Polarella glacialis, Strain CCMP 1383" /LENGTH=410 /DNA_ID=CAMNT_0002432191 /DNA_START=78 /DNA_END=1310 /DNA_ORIENTATION=-